MADRILIVEDERITAEDLRDILTGLGYEVTAVVSTGVEAIREAERNPPDLALMDIRIKGDLDGTETAQILQERFSIPVVYLTAYADAKTLERAKRSRPLGYVVKPYQESELQASLEIALHHHRCETQVHHERRHLSGVLGAVELGIVSVDPDGSVVLINPVAEELTGWDSGSAIGQPVSAVAPLCDPTTGEPIDLQLADAMRSGTAIDVGAVCLVTREMLRCPVSGHVSVIKGPNGEPAGTVIMIEPAPVPSSIPHLISREKDKSATSLLRFGRFNLVAASEHMRQLISFVLRVARSDAPAVLIQGEPGTGKDTLAHLLHYCSDRRSGPFVPLSCSSMSSAWIEEELFGCQQGSRDHPNAKKGLLEVASGGTLYLDEVGELPISLHAQLLAMLKNRSFKRVGGQSPVELNVRLIVSTSRHLPDAVRDGTFRLELFQKLSAVTVSIAPLRKHPTDILPLAEYFLQMFRQKYSVHATELSPDAASMLQAHPWPGNVQELRSAIGYAVSRLDVSAKWLYRSDLKLEPVREREISARAGSSGSGAAGFE